MTKEDYHDIVPLTQNLSKLTHNEFVAPSSAPPRERSKSMTFATPGTRNARPLPQAFNSTGILSKKNKSATKHKITPETPIKAKSRGMYRASADPVQQSPVQFGHTPLKGFQQSPFDISGTPVKQRSNRFESQIPLGFTPNFGEYSTQNVYTPFSPIEEEHSQLSNFSITPQKSKDGDDNSSTFSIAKVKDWPDATPLMAKRVDLLKSTKKVHKFGTFELGKTPIRNLEFNSPFEAPPSTKSDKLHTRSPLKESPTKRVHLDLFESDYQKNVPESPPNDPKIFFSKLIKERKPTIPNPIPFSMFISTTKFSIGLSFFKALDGIQPFLDEVLNDFSNSESTGDYFETRFELIGRLGQGQFADAFHVQSLEDLQEYAIKKTRHPFTGYKNAVEKLQEIKMLLLIGEHPNCVLLKQAWIQYGYIYIQTELCSRGNLSTYLEEYCSEVALNEDQIWRIAADIISGVAHIHSQGIIHLDLKPANIFISASGKLLIGDFGLAAHSPLINGDHEGDRTYLAPECLTKMVTFQADIFSLGLMLLEMAANIILPENGPVWNQLRNGQLSGIDLSMHSKILADFIKSMLSPVPSERPTSNDLLKHPFIRKQLDEL